MKPVCSETRVLGEKGRDSCVTEAVCCWSARVYSVCEEVWQQCTAVLLSVWAAGTVRSLLSKSELQNVIGAQCTYGPLNDVGRFEQLTCDPRRRLGGMGRGRGYLV